MIIKPIEWFLKTWNEDSQKNFILIFHHWFITILWVTLSFLQYREISQLNSENDVKNQKFKYLSFIIIERYPFRKRIILNIWICPYSFAMYAKWHWNQDKSLLYSVRDHNDLRCFGNTVLRILCGQANDVRTIPVDPFLRSRRPCGLWCFFSFFSFLQND